MMAELCCVEVNTECGERDGDECPLVSGAGRLTYTRAAQGQGQGSVSGEIPSSTMSGL